jgi:outer membrane receptor protein involved in Fe transport
MLHSLFAPLAPLAIVLTIQTMPPQSTSGGTVVDASGAPVAGAKIRTRPASVEVVTGADGTFELTGLPPRVVLIISAPGHADLVTVVDGTAGMRRRFVLEPKGIVESVTVSGDASNRITTPGSATVIDAEAMEAFPAFTVDDRLRSIPGFSLFRRSSSRVANPTTQGVTLRGLSGSGASRTAVFADGIPANDPFGGWVYWNRIPIAAINRIEVSRGGSSDLHGSDAMGGAIRIETASRGAMAIGEAGEDGTGRLSMFGGHRFDRWEGRAAVERSVTDGYVLVGPESRGTIDVPASSRHTTAYAGAGAPLGPVIVDLRGGYFTESRGNGTPFQTNETVIRHGSGSARGSMFDGAWTARGSLASQDYDQTFSSVGAGRASEAPVSVQHVDSTAKDFGFEWLRPQKRGALLLGATSRLVDAQLADLSFFTGVTTATDAEQRTHAAFAQTTMTFGRATIGAGLRGEVWRSRRANGSDERDESFIVPRASVAFRANEFLSLRATYQDGHRSPTVNELYRDFRVGAILTRANAALGPEQSRGWEASALFTRPWMSARTAFFWTTMDDAIVSVTLVSSPAIIRQRQNAGRIRARGMEIETDVRLAHGVALTGTVAFIDSAFTRGTDLAGLKVPQVPRVQASAGFRGAWTHATAALEWRFIGHQFDDDRNTPSLELDRSSIVDLKGAWRARRGFELFAALENAFDADQDVGKTPLRTIGLPRTFRAGVRWQLR